MPISFSSTIIPFEVYIMTHKYTHIFYPESVWQHHHNVTLADSRPCFVFCLFYSSFYSSRCSLSVSRSSSRSFLLQHNCLAAASVTNPSWTAEVCSSEWHLRVRFDIITSSATSTRVLDVSSRLWKFLLAFPLIKVSHWNRFSKSLHLLSI